MVELLCLFCITCKIMKLALVAATIFTLTLGLYTPKVTAAPAQTPKTFTEWCQEKASLPQETRGTVEALLKVAKTQNCSQANQMLTNLTSLKLRENKISDIKPLSNLMSNLTKLTELSLSGNPLTSKKCPTQPESICRF